MSLLAEWGGGSRWAPRPVTGSRHVRRWPSSPSARTPPVDYLRGGAAAERVWISANRNDLGVQPMSPVFLYARDDTRQTRAVRPVSAIELAHLQRRFEAVVGLQPHEAPALVLRLSHHCRAAPYAAPACRWRRSSPSLTGRRWRQRRDGRQPEPGRARHLGRLAPDGCHRNDFARVCDPNCCANWSGHFDVDLSFLRRNDHIAGTTTLVAEWPPQAVRSGARPVGRCAFAGADRTFAATEHLTTVMITHPDGADDDYQDTVREGSGLPGFVSSATVPLLSNDGTMGVLGFIKFGDREWGTPRSTRCGRSPPC